MKGFPWAAGLWFGALPLLQESLKFAGVGWGAVCITRGFWVEGSYGSFLASYFLLRSSYIALSSMTDLYSRSSMSALLTKVWKSGKSSMLPHPFRSVKVQAEGIPCSHPRQHD